MIIFNVPKDCFSGKFDLTNWDFHQGEWIREDLVKEAYQEACVNSLVEDAWFTIAATGDGSDAEFRFSFACFGDTDHPEWSIPFEAIYEDCKDGGGISHKQAYVKALRRLADRLESLPD